MCQSKYALMLEMMTMLLLCNCGTHIMSGFEIIKGGSGLNRVKILIAHIATFGLFRISVPASP